MIDHGDFFNRDELKCRCGCEECRMDEKFMGMLDEARLLAGIPFPINSGYRCEKHNRAVGSTSENHPSGKAADIKCDVGANRRLIINALRDAGFNRLGIGPTFIHADITDAPKSYWLY